MTENWDIIGHQNIIRFLQKSLDKNRLASAYLFYGTEGLGKTTVAEKFAAKLLGSKLKTEFYPLRPAEDKKDITIEQVREWRRSLSLKNFGNDYKVGMIYEAEKLNNQSANALLKTIEEPLSKTVIIVIASDWERLLDTIISRCLVLRFMSVSAEEMRQAFADKPETSNMFDEMLILAQGRPGALINILESAEKYTELNQLQSDLSGLTTIDVNGRWKFLNSHFDSLKTFTEKTNKASVLLDHLEIFLNKKILSEYKKETKPDYNHYLKIYKFINEARDELRLNVQPKLILENLFLNI